MLPEPAPERPEIPRTARVVQILSILGLALYLSLLLAGIPGGPLGEDLVNRWLYCGLILAAVAGCWLRVVHVRTERPAWLALTAGLAAWAAGEITFAFVYGGDPPFPSAADFFYLLFYPACYVALGMLVRTHVRGLNPSLWLDGLMASTAAGAVGAALVLQAVLESTDGSRPTVMTNLAYPLGDVILLALVVGVFAVTRWRPGRVWAVIGGAFLASALADSVYLYQAASGTYVEGTILDALWPTSMLLLAHAALAPGPRPSVDLEGRPLLATPLACGLAGLGVLVYDHFRELNLLALVLAGTTVASVIVRTGLTFRENARILERMRAQSVTDSLTGLGNRRKLVADLESVLARPPADEPWILIVFDLDGFKHYNDTFGHPAGDALLARLGARLADAAEPYGAGYRLGGDEFCVLARVPAEGAESLIDETSRALSERGEGFQVAPSFGAVFVPEEAAEAREALRIADQRLYAQKHSARMARAQPHEVLLQALYEREPELRQHVDGVARLSLALGRRLGLSPQELDELRLAAQLHDVGKLAIPDGVLQKPGALDEEEWAFVRQHTLIGQRILSAAPALHDVGKIVRSTHERWDGTGYVDGLAGEAIPLAARIIAVCDAYAAMTSKRPYCPTLSREEALAELRRCAGTQFDPAIVEAFCKELARLEAAVAL